MIDKGIITNLVMPNAKESIHNSINTITFKNKSYIFK